MDQDLTIRITGLDHGSQDDIDRFCDNFSAIAPFVRIEPWEEGSLSPKGPPLPGMALADNIFWCAIPLERELSPFLDSLTLVRFRSPEPEKKILEKLKQIQVPCDLTLYIAQHCPHCPKVVDTILPLAVFSDKIRLTIIDGSLFPEAARESRVMSAPCLILDEEFRWTGQVSATEIITMMAGKDVSRLSARSLKGIIEEGDAQWITDQMIAKNTVFPGVVDLLVHETWSVRLGAMVIVESLSEEHPDLARQLCPRLMDMFSDKDIPVQGDILYALGQAGDLKIRDWLGQTLETLEHPDLKEACRDAMADIEDRLS